MRKIVLLTIFVLSTVSAGNMRSGYDFIQEMIKGIGVQETGCASISKMSTTSGYVCATLPLLQDVEIIKNQWDSLAEIASKKLGYIYTSKSKWSVDPTIGDYKLYSLNNDLHLVNILRNTIVADGIKFASVSGYGVEPVTAQSSIPSTQPSLPVVQPPVAAAQAPQSRIFDLEVTRYLCQPSANGFARVFGTVRNTSNRTFKFLEFSVEFFNGSQFVGQESSYVKADDLAPNAETTFETLTRVGAYTRCTLSFEDKAGKLNIKLP